MMSVAARSVLAAAALTAAIGGAACGKKGAPLPPLVRIPAAVDKVAASRLGNEVYVTLTVPATNIDTSVPVDISRVDIYGYTGRIAPTPARWAELGAVVATIPVAPPPPVGQAVNPPPSANVLSGGALPGTPVTILDTLTPDEFTQGKVVAIVPQRAEPVPLPVLGPPTPTVLRRFYLAIPFSQRGRPGQAGTQAELVLTALPDPPAGVRITYDALTLSLMWEPSGGLLGFLLDRPLPPEPVPFDTPQLASAVPQTLDAAVPPGPTTYNVYRDLAPDPFVLPLDAGMPSWAVPAPAAMNPPPGAATSVTDAVEFGRERCYTVRAVRGAATSEGAPRVCIMPVDVFPPAVPAGLAAVPSEGGISLIWEPNSELDLGGYLVLRREADAALRQLTDTPIRDARYRDTTVQPGSRYTYSVVAVDTQLPLPNVSAESAPVEETAR